ncbi:MAG: hypothetical protein ACREFX_05420 [Opitutaceae bacterium]
MISRLRLLLLPLAVLLPAVLSPAARAAVTIENREIRLVLSDDARVVSLVYKPTGEECLAPGANVPAFEAVQYRGYIPDKVTPAHSVRREGDRLIVSFAPLVTVAVFRLRVTDSYIGITLERAAGPGEYGQSKAWYSEFNDETEPFDELRFAQLPLRERGKFGSWLNVDWNRRLAIALVPTDPYADVGSDATPHGRVLRASAWPSVRMAPVGVALVLADPADLLGRLDRVEADYGLPRGARSRMSAAVTHSYWDVEDPLTPGNVSRIIDYAHAAGLKDIQVYHHAFAKSGGHFPWRPEYPHGMADLRAATDRMRAAGITVGLHIHFNKANVNDSYVTPVPDPRLNLRRHFTLAAPLGVSGTRLRVFENPYGCTLDDKRRILRFGDELISYRSYTTRPPYTFLGCGRGALGTRPAAHSAGLIGGLLDVDNWPVWVRFNQRTDIGDEVARRIASIYAGAGFRFVYFDGSEDVPPPFWFNIGNAQWRVYRLLRPEPLFCEASNLSPFDWNMMSRSFGEDAAMPELVKALVRNRRLSQAADMALNFTRCDFGWLHLRPPGPNTIGMQPDMIEYVVSRGAGWGCPVSIIAGLDELAANPRTPDNLEVLRRWERARTSGWLTKAWLRELRGPEPEVTLLIDERGRFELEPCERIPVAGGAGTVRAFLLERKGQPVVSFWDTRGRSALAVPLGGARVELCRDFGHPLPVVRTPEGVRVTAAGRQYLEVPGATPAQVRAAFAAATVHALP